MKPACQQQMTEHKNQARREILLSCIAIALITAVTLFIARTDDNHLRHEIQRIDCEKKWLAAVVSTQSPEMRERLMPITAGRIPTQVATSITCSQFFNEIVE